MLFGLGRGEQFQHCDDELARGLIVPALVAHDDFQQLIHGHGPLVVGQQGAGAAKACVKVALVGGDQWVVFGHIGVVAFGGKFQRLEPLVQRFKAQRLRNALDGLGQQGAGFFKAAGGDQQAHIVKACVVVGGIGRQCIGHFLQCGLGVASRQQGLRFVDFRFSRHLVASRQVLVEEFAQLAFGLSPCETVHGLAFNHQHASGNGANAKHAGQLLLLIRVDLGQLEAAFVGDFQLFQNRAQRLAGAAPGRPEVHQHRHLGRGGYDFGFKILDGDVNHVIPNAVRGTWRAARKTSALRQPFKATARCSDSPCKCSAARHGLLLAPQGADKCSANRSMLRPLHLQIGQKHFTFKQAQPQQAPVLRVRLTRPRLDPGLISAANQGAKT